MEFILEKKKKSNPVYFIKNEISEKSLKEKFYTLKDSILVKEINTEKDEDGERKTRRVEDGCIFLNRKGYEAEGFTGSFGCVLHHVAQRDGKHFADTKPDVCWQLPLRRSFETREYGEREYSVTVIGEYERLAWGDGGEDFDWYCTSNSDAHVGTEPVYISNKYELELLMGKDAYAELARLCDVRMEHIRDSAARSLPLFIIQHPATLAAQKK